MNGSRDPLNYDANGGPVNQLMGRLAIGAAQRAHIEAAHFVMHPVQIAMAENLDITVNTVIHGGDVLKKVDMDKLADFPKTFCGRPIVSDPKMPEDVIELRDKAGSTIARIKNLAVPK